MANPTPSPSPQKQESGSAYCSDLECHRCQELQAIANTPFLVLALPG
jgi:hypothetical protein